MSCSFFSVWDLAGAVVVQSVQVFWLCVSCVHLCARVSVRAPANSPGLAQALGAVLGTEPGLPLAHTEVNTALQVLWQPPAQGHTPF